MHDAEKDWNEFSFRVSGAINDCKKSLFDEFDSRLYSWDTRNTKAYTYPHPLPNASKSYSLFKARNFLNALEQTMHENVADPYMLYHTFLIEPALLEQFGFTSYIS